MYATTTTLAVTMIGVNFDTATSALASQMITKAEARINMGLSKRYDITSIYFQTTTSVPPMVREMTETLAEGYMWKSLSRGSKESMSRGQTLIDEILGKSTGGKQLGDNGMLSNVSTYKADLLDTAGSIIPDSSKTPFRIQSNNTNYTDTFDEGPEKEWVADSDKLEDISNSKD